MARPRTVHRCSDCGAAFARWSGRCATCGEWNTLVEEREEPRGVPAAAGADAVDAPVPLPDVDAGDWQPVSTGVEELDRVLGGGLVPGSVTLVGGEPGIGKSTLLLQALGAMADRGRRVLLVSAEESKPQVRLRGERLGVLHRELWLAAETSVPAIVAMIEDLAPEVLVVDSIQTVGDPDLASPPGSVAQVRDCTSQFVRVAKERGTTILLVGHVTKEGALAGPRVLEHLVDTVLSFEGERHHALRLLRAVKHRFGSTGELGLFEMAGDGLWGVPDASGLLLGDRRAGVAGSVVVPAIEGRRPLLVEVQALVTPSNLPQPRRSAQGLDAGRLALLVAVLAQRADVNVAGNDVYASVVGGVRITEPAADLAVALGLASAAGNVPLPPDVVVLGEVGLGGEVRQVGQSSRRLEEASRLGFRAAVIPASSPAGPPALACTRVATLRDAVDALGLREGARG